MQGHWQSLLGGLILSVATLPAAACFTPSYQEGLACSETGNCPEGQLCSGGYCSIASAAADASPDGEAPCLPGSQTFKFTGTIENFDVPDCATEVTIEALGAQGGGGSGAGNESAGGRGTRIRGVFSLDDNNTLTILVGQRGADAPAPLEQGGGSGGGGSFVVNAFNEPLLIAGGGGGATDSSVLLPGGDAQIGETGQDGGGDDPGIGGSGGGGGTTYLNVPGGFHTGTAGAGFLSSGIGISNGDESRFGTPNHPGTRYLSGGNGGLAGSLGRNGGFGGGGSAGFTGAGGGGYSGGGSGGPPSNNATYGGGGGGSFNAAVTGQDNVPGVGVGDGQVTITW